MNRTLMLAYFLVLLIGARIYFLTGDGSPEQPADLAGPITEQVAATVGLADARLPKAVEVPGLVDPERVEVMASQVPVSKSAEEVDGLISGRVQIEELDGSLNMEASGTLVLSVKQQRRTYELSVAIKAGVWELPKAQLVDLLKRRRLRPEGEVRFAGVTIPGRSTRLAWQGARPKALLSDRGILLRLKAGETGRLIVEDAVTRAPLSNVTVLNSMGISSYQRNESGRSDFPIMIESGTSPIALGLATQMENYAFFHALVGSPGYAWKEVKADLEPGSESRVFLQRAGHLEVSLDSLPDVDGLYLYLRRPSTSRPLISIPVEGPGPYLFEDIGVGAMQVRVALGGYGTEPLEFGVGETQIVAGTTTHFGLVVDAPPIVESAGLAGRMELDSSAWELERFTLQVQRLGPAVSGDGTNAYHNYGPIPAGSDGVFPFDFGELATGQYLMSLIPVGYAVVMELSAQGEVDYTFKVPKPANISVFLKNSASGAMMRTPRVIGSVKLPEGISQQVYGNLSPVDASQPDGDEPYRLRLPAGAAMITCLGDQISNFQIEIAATDGLELVLDVGPPTGVVISLLHAGKRVEWPFRMEPDDVLVEGSSGHLTGIDRRAKGSQFFGVSESGPYSFKIPQIEGYELHEPIEVEIVKGEEILVEVELTRIP